MLTVQEVFAKWPSLSEKFDHGNLQVSMAAAENLCAYAVKRLLSVVNDHRVPSSSIYVGHSGGKDSVVAHYIAQFAFGNNLPVLHTVKLPTEKNAPHPKTVQFMYELAAKHDVRFLPLDIDQTRLGFSLQIDGTRALEAERSDGRSTDLVFDGVTINRKNMQTFNPCGLFGNAFVYPIYDWTDTQVWATIFALDLPFSEEYLEVEWKAES